MSTQQPHPPDELLGHPAADDRMLTSEQLLLGRREVLIRHGNEIYRLRLTRQGKLILQK